MAKTFVQFVASAAGPLLTLGFAALVLPRVGGRDDPADAIGAGLAAAVLFGMVQTVEALPKKSTWWRSRFDKRAVFEGVWLQIHEHEPGRVAVFAFVYSPETDEYVVGGDAFDSAGEHLANWKSTQVFFSSGLRDLSYLWEGKGRGVIGKGTTTLWLDRVSRSRRPMTGTGEAVHLMQPRCLDFRLRRVTGSDLERLECAFGVKDLESDFECRKALAHAWAKAQSEGRKQG